jgi:hypothetical protein
VFPQGFALWGEEPGSALDVYVLCFHGFHDEFFLFFVFRDKVFDLAGDEAKSCFGQELPFRHCFMAHSFISFPGWVAENWKWEWPELVKELLDKSSLRWGDGDDLITLCFNLIDLLAQLRKISSANWSAKVTDKYQHRVLTVNGLF